MTMTTETNSLQAKSSALCISLFVCCMAQSCHVCLVAVCLIFRLMWWAVVGTDEMAAVIQEKLKWVISFLPPPLCLKQWWKKVNKVTEKEDHIAASNIPLVIYILFIYYIHLFYYSGVLSIFIFEDAKTRPKENKWIQVKGNNNWRCPHCHRHLQGGKFSSFLAYTVYSRCKGKPSRHSLTLSLLPLVSVIAACRVSSAWSHWVHICSFPWTHGKIKNHFG